MLAVWFWPCERLARYWRAGVLNKRGPEARRSNRGGPPTDAVLVTCV